MEEIKEFNIPNILSVICFIFLFPSSSTHRVHQGWVQVIDRFHARYLECGQIDIRGRISSKVRALTLEIYKPIYQQIYCYPSRMVWLTPCLWRTTSALNSSTIKLDRRRSSKWRGKWTLTSEQELKYEIFWMAVPCWFPVVGSQFY